MRSGRRSGVRTGWRSLAAIAGVSALLALAVFGAAVRGPWVIEPRDYDFAFAPPPQQTQPPADVATAEPPALAEPGATPHPLDLTWLGLVGAAVVASGIAYLIWRLWLRYREQLPDPETPRGQAIVDAADVLPDIPVLLRGVEAARQSLALIADPTDAVISAWLSLEEAAARSGVMRHPASTPTEFTVAMLTATKAAPDATDELLALYELARFSTHPVTPEHVERASRCLGEIAASWHLHTDADAKADAHATTTASAGAHFGSDPS